MPTDILAQISRLEFVAVREPAVSRHHVETQLRPPPKPLEHHSSIVPRGFRGPLNWCPPGTSFQNFLVEGVNSLFIFTPTILLLFFFGSYNFYKFSIIIFLKRINHKYVICTLRKGKDDMGFKYATPTMKIKTYSVQLLSNSIIIIQLIIVPC